MSKTLVAFFSASGVTKKVAEKIANSANADIFEIEPQEKYTKADLNWMNKQSRSSIEMKNKSFRPPISSTVADMDEYDTVYVGFPIWWYVAPTIINTFLEQYDWHGKTIIVFATSGTSGLGNTIDELKTSAPGAVWSEKSARLKAKASQEEIEKWVNG